MKYSKLVDLYEFLEKTPAKLKKRDAIAEVFKKAETGVLSKLALLVQGKLFPAWDEREIGVAGKMMIKTIALAAGFPEKEIVSRFNKIGDLGLVAEELVGQKKQRTLFQRGLTVDKVFENLQRVALEEGARSQDRKMKLVSELITSASPKEAKYIVRTVLEELRVGVAEGIIRDAIAEAFGIPKEVVEGAWFLKPDYSEIIKIAKERGEEGLKKVKLELGVPVHVLLAERSPDLKTAVEKFEHSVMEFKFDGARCLVHKKGEKIWLFTRRLEDVTKAFPDIVELAKKSLKPKECIVDGEMIGLDSKTHHPVPFQMLSTRIKRKHDIHRAAKETPVQVNLFDMIYLDGKNLFGLALKERRNLLERSVNPSPGKFQLAEQLVTRDLKEADSFYKEALKAGHEGLIVKSLDAVYQPGRRVAGGWLKVKPIMETLDLVVIGATHGTGKRTGWLGSFILGCRDPETGKFLECGMMGTGVKEKKTTPEDVTFKELSEMLKPHIISEKGNEVKVKPKTVIEVAYEEIQKSPKYSSGFALRFPRFLRLRHMERGPEESDTINRIKKIYGMQRGRGHKKA